MTTVTERQTREAGLDACIDRAAAALLERQRPDGSWEGFLSSSSVSTAAAVIALHIVGPVAHAGLIRAGADWICADQNPDGGWPDAPGGPSTLNATAIATAAVRVVRPEARAVVDGARAAIEGLGGRPAIEDMRRTTLSVTCLNYLAFAGLYDERRVPRIPVEIVLLPQRLRQKMSFIMPALLASGIMHARTRPTGAVRRWIGRRAEARALAYLREIQEFEGPDGGCEESVFVAAVMIFGLARAGVGDDVLEHNLRYILKTVRPDGSWPIDRDLELSGTCYVTRGLQEAGWGDDPRLRPTRAFIERSQRRVPLGATGCPPGGWGWSMPSSWPDTDDTSHALLTLARFGVDERDEHVRQGVSWLHAMRNGNGSWSCFVHNGRRLFDAPCAACTSHAAVALHAFPGRHGLDRAVRWLARAQRRDGGVSCVWFRDLTSGTARVLETLGELGLAKSQTARGCLRWLLGHQEPGGGWGDGRGAEPTAEETAWAVLGLIGSGHAGHPATAAGVRWLMARQRPDGTWPAGLVAYYYPELTYWCDAMANGYALQALGRYRAALSTRVGDLSELGLSHEATMGTKHARRRAGQR
jgi:squalene-hopene/tetraprenyl-beta-curcumene cyclase